MKDDLAGVAEEQLGEVVIAYEPIWAIGTGRVATSAQVQEAIGFIRALVGDRDAGGGGTREDHLRRVGQAGERAGAAGRSRTSMARSWVALRCRPGSFAEIVLPLSEPARAR